MDDQPAARPDDSNFGPSRLEAARISRLRWYQNTLLRFNEATALDYATPLRTQDELNEALHSLPRNKGNK